MSIAHQGTMVEIRGLPPKSTIDQELSGSGYQQVFSSNHFADLHAMFIDRHGQLIGWHSIGTPDHKITKVASCFIR